MPTNQQQIAEFILAQQGADIWPWFVSYEEMFGNPQRLQEVEQILTDMDATETHQPEHVFAALTEVFGANPLFVEKQQRKPYGLFTITAEGITQHYCAESFGGIVEVLDLLQRVHTAKDRVPSITQSDAARLVMYSKTMLPISVSPSLRLFQPISSAKFLESLAEIQCHPTQNTVVRLDYDSDRWEHSQWTDDGFERLSAPLSQAITVFEQALQKRGRSRIYLKESILADGLERICEVSVTSIPTKRQDFSPTMQM